MTNDQFGSMPMERIEHIFCTAYSREHVPYHTRITPPDSR